MAIHQNMRASTVDTGTIPDAAIERHRRALAAHTFPTAEEMAAQQLFTPCPSQQSLMNGWQRQAQEALQEVIDAQREKDLAPMREQLATTTDRGSLSNSMFGARRGGAA